MGVRTRTRAWRSGLLATGLLLGGALTAMPAAYAAVPRTEVPVSGTSPVTSVVESDVGLWLPLPLSRAACREVPRRASAPVAAT